jgi:aminodeoxyfutalosine synthase
MSQSQVTSTMETITSKVYRGERLTDEDALFLFERGDLLEIGRLADFANRRKNQDVVYFNVNRHINPTNICAMSCKFCAYSKKPGEEGAYAYSIEEIIGKAAEVVRNGATEVHMVGGLHPRWKFSDYTKIVAAVHDAFPQLHIKAFTAVELDWMARRERRSVEEILTDLRNAGLGSLPGGGAEIFHPEIREQICDTKTDGDRWIEIHRTAHKLGLRSNCTMLYGHIESYRHRVDHLRRLRELQDETGGFNAFIPLAFQPYDNAMGISRYTRGEDDLRVIGIARLYLDNFANVKSYWIMLGQDIAQIALNFGANDLDGTVTEEKISRAAGGRAGIIMNRSELESLIRKAGKTPVERDTLYRPIGVVPSAKPVQDNHSSLLYKASRGAPISESDALTLANESYFFDLVQCAQNTKSRFVSQGLASFGKAFCTGLFDEEDLSLGTNADARQTPQFDASQMSLIVDCSRGGAHGFSSGSALKDLIVERIGVLQRSYGARTVALAGVKSIMNLARSAGVELKSFLSELAGCGVSLVCSASGENEQDLTNAELTEFHRLCHEADIRSVPRVVLSGTMESHSSIFWNNFIKRINDLGALQSATHGIGAIEIVPDPEVVITPMEYLRAIAVARVIASGIHCISTPFSEIPTLRDTTKSKNSTKDMPALKLAALCTMVGASDLGNVDIRKFDIEVLMSELELSHAQPVSRGSSVCDGFNSASAGI